MVSDIKLKLSRKHEQDIHALIGGHSTKSSGNQWHDAADGKTNPYEELSVAWDCKAAMPGTKSMSTTRDDLIKIQEQARGRKFAMPMRWYETERGAVEFDMMLIPLEDYLELRALAEEALELRSLEGVSEEIREIANLVDRSGVYDKLHDLADRIDL